MIPSWLLKLPNILPINVHFSLLPKYRGASPIQSALLHGDISSGITIIKMSESLDAGDIISSIGVKIDSEDNRLTLEKKLTNLCIKELPKILSLIKSNQAVSRKQDHSSATYCEKILKSDSIIDFKENSKDIKECKREELIDRLIIDDNKIESIRNSINQILPTILKLCIIYLKTHFVNLTFWMVIIV